MRSRQGDLERQGYSSGKAHPYHGQGASNHPRQSLSAGVRKEGSSLAGGGKGRGNRNEGTERKAPSRSVWPWRRAQVQHPVGKEQRLARGWEERRFLHLGCTGMWLHWGSLSTRGQERPTHEARAVRAVELPEGHLALAGGAGRSGERVGRRSLQPSLLSETLSRRTSEPLGYTEPGKCCETGSPMQRVHLKGDPRQCQRAPGSELLVQPPHLSIIF